MNENQQQQKNSQGKKNSPLFVVVIFFLLFDSFSNLLISFQNSPQLMLAGWAKEGNIAAIRQAIQTGFDLNDCDESGLTLLHNACQFGNMQVVSFLLEQGCDYNRTCMGRTALYLAARHNKEPIVRALVEAGANVNLGHEGRTPFFVACREGCVGVVAYLSHFVDVNQTCNGISPFFEACWRGHLAIAEFLANSNKCDINQQTNDGATPLFAASRMGHASIVRFLLSRHAAIELADSNGVTPFFVACHEGHLDVATVLASAGCDTSRRCNSGKSPLFSACQNGKVNIVEALVELKKSEIKLSRSGTTVCNSGSSSGAGFKVPHSTRLSRSFSGCAELLKDFLQTPDTRGRTPMLAAVASGQLAIVKILQSLGCSVDQADNDNVTPMIIACEKGHYEIAEFLSSVGCDLERGNLLFVAASKGHVKIVQLLAKLKCSLDKKVCGATPFYIACQEGFIQIVQFLMDSGCQVNVKLPNGATPFFAACWKGEYEVVKFLLDRKTVDVKSGLAGCSPLFVACQGSHHKIIRLLLEDGHDPDQADACGVTPLWWACWKGHLETVKLLCEFGADINRVCLNSQSGTAACSPCFIACQSKHYRVLEYLLKQRCDCDLPDTNDVTPLSLACWKGDEIAVQALCEHGADINRPCDQRTPLYTASRHGWSRVVKILLKFRCDISLTCRGVDSFQVACCYRHYDVAHLLARTGMDLNNLTQKYRHSLRSSAQALNGDQINVIRMFDRTNRPSDYPSVDVILRLPTHIIVGGLSSVKDYLLFRTDQAYSLCMGIHPSLGSCSTLKGVPVEILQHIFRFVNDTV